MGPAPLRLATDVGLQDPVGDATAAADLDGRDLAGVNEGVDGAARDPKQLGSLIHVEQGIGGSLAPESTHLLAERLHIVLEAMNQGLDRGPHRLDLGVIGVARVRFNM
jgi:hypothetical protein